MKDAIDRAVEWFIVALFLLLAVPAMWAALPPSDTKTLLMAIMLVGDIYFWISPVRAIIEWIGEHTG